MKATGLEWEICYIRVRTIREGDIRVGGRFRDIFLLLLVYSEKSMSAAVACLLTSEIKRQDSTEDKGYVRC